jgi:hypothetical protein
MTPLNALVLGGGGPVGAAWLSAALNELAAAGLPPAESGVVLGTSAGAVSDAWLTMDPRACPRCRNGWPSGPGSTAPPWPGGDKLAREEASLNERGHHVRVIVAEKFYAGMADLLDPDFVDLAATVGARQARDSVADLATWWNA